MKEVWLSQLNNIKKIIDGSLVTLQNLVEQSKSLREVIDSIETNEKNKKTLTAIKDSIDNDISALVSKISDLFNSYNEMIDSIC